MKTHRNIHTIIAFFNSHTSVHTDFIKSILILSTVTLIIPVLQGCSKSTHPQDGDFTEQDSTSSVKFAVHHPTTAKVHSIDALVFNDDPLQRIDCYQRTVGELKQILSVGSGSGDKIVLLCANLDWDADSWRRYNSFSKAREIKIDLETESRSNPIMATATYVHAGEHTEVMLERISSEIVLRSICCDFKGKPYAGESITDARAYLINVNGTSSVMPQKSDPVVRLINHGGLIDQDVMAFQDKSMILCDLGEISSKIIYPSCNLICYPNMVTEESMGVSYTRLVIEGKILGQKWYWPININRENSGQTGGIERNCQYIYDITIRSKGTKDPNTPITPEMTEIIFEAKTWTEKEEYHIAF